MDYCLPGSSVHGIAQGRILHWVAIPFSKGENPGLLHCKRILYHLSHQCSAPLAGGKVINKINACALRLTCFLVGKMFSEALIILKTSLSCFHP